MTRHLNHGHFAAIVVGALVGIVAGGAALENDIPGYLSLAIGALGGTIMGGAVWAFAGYDYY